MKFKLYFLESRPQFLILPLVLCFLGTAIAWFYGYFNLGYALLATFGLIMAHTSVNTLNDYCDYNSGVDLATKQTPFSGGSGMLPAALLKPEEVLRMTIITFLIAAGVGIYFVFVTGWQLFPLLLVGALCIFLYTPFILKQKWPEWSPGVGLGTLPVMGAYFVQTSEYTWPLLIASIPSGILVCNLLFLNEFPDTEADKTVNRKTTPIIMGKEKASRIYAALTLLVYLWIIVWVIAGTMPVFSLLALLTLPIAVKAIKGAMNYQDMKQLMPAMAANVMVVLLTQLLLGVGYILAGVF
jgi:1,4-dihydroxy-2-naphthoate polyprenyltransferase